MWSSRTDSEPGCALRLLCAAAALCFATAHAAELQVRVQLADGRAVADAVVIAAPLEGAPRVSPPRQPEVIDQVNMEFVPRVKAILVGSAIQFPNGDNVRHHVYSFSGAKRFELPLYTGTPAKPVVFEQAGVVTLGCNIHDWMVGYIYVSESPHFGVTGDSGSLRLQGLAPGQYLVRVWHPQLEGAESGTRQLVDLKAAPGAALAWTIALRPEARVRRAPVSGTHRHY